MSASTPEVSRANPERKLSSTMMANIAILSTVGFVLIVLMFFGDFDDKGTRVFGTFLAFLIFTAFTAIDTSDRWAARSVPLATATNILFLALSLVSIWGILLHDSRHDYYYLEGTSGLLSTFGLAIVVRIGSMLVQKILQFVPSPAPSVSLASKIAVGSISISILLLVIPMGFNFIDFADIYWRITVAFLLVAGVIMSVLTLLVWSFRVEGQGNPFRNPSTKRQTPVTAPQRRQEPVNAQPATVGVTEAQAGPQPAYPVYEKPQKALTPWPVFPDGRPLPALPNGRPDFNALQVVSAMYIAAEKQFFS